MELLPILFKLKNIVLQVSEAYLYGSRVIVQKTGIFHKSGRSKFALCYHGSFFPSAIHVRTYTLISCDFVQKVLLLFPSLEGNLYTLTYIRLVLGKWSDFPDTAAATLQPGNEILQKIFVRFPTF